MKSLSSFQNRTKLYKVIPNSKPIRNSNANHSKLTLLKKNRKDSRLTPSVIRIELLSIAELNYTKLVELLVLSKKVKD